jgi:hypothetical protein
MTKPIKKVLILKTVNAGMTSFGGFRWPKQGAVKCGDWKPVKECGNGLHGLLWGCGDGSLINWSSDAVWLIFSAYEKDVVDIDTHKVKVPRGVVVHCGTRESATEYLVKHGAKGSIVGSTATAGDMGTATAGYRGTATAGYRGIFILRWFDGKTYNLAVGKVGEDGIKANTPYRVDDKGKFYEVAL